MYRYIVYISVQEQHLTILNSALDSSHRPESNDISHVHIGTWEGQNTLTLLSHSVSPQIAIQVLGLHWNEWPGKWKKSARPAPERPLGVRMVCMDSPARDLNPVPGGGGRTKNVLAPGRGPSYMYIQSGPQKCLQFARCPRLPSVFSTVAPMCISVFPR